MRALQTAALLLLALAIFKAVQLLTTPVFDFTLAVDQLIPFVPQTLPVYLAFFPYILVVAWRVPPDAHRTLQIACLIAFALGLLCFVLFPAAMPRPDPACIDNAFLRQRFTRMWAVDAAHNTFPSLHVAATVVAMRIGKLAYGIGVLICLSTLTVKQHTLLDVLFGALVGLIAVYAASARRGE